ncbi:MAG: helix-turn-helix domain-containing protein, partial [Eudoraea sp.]|uniref:helix-turn-helix domain-containing protein n=1 Tax=Eudoraea sp. TaxID=1979955 RepID=UPI003C7694C4
LKSITGKSASRFMRQYRLRKAKEMLADNVATASEIAYRVGFSSPTYFNTCFRIYYGYSPGKAKYRNKDADPEISTKELVMEVSKPPLTNTYDKVGDKPFKKRFVLVPVLVSVLLFLVVYILYLRFDSADSTQTISISSTDKSIAVLPFKNYSGDPEMDPFCEGMTDEVISRLTKIKSFTKVSSRTSILPYKESGKSMPEIASELGVTHILEGSFQKSGDKIKVNLQLIDGSSDNHFWADEYTGDWNSDDIFKIQAEVAENVARNMDVQISDSEQEGIQKIPTNNHQAYTNYVLAQSQKYKFSRISIQNAIPLFNKAIALDSSYVDPYIGLADTYIMGGLVWGVFKEQEAWRNAKGLLQIARGLDPSNEQIEAELNAGYFYFDWNFELVESYYQKRLENFVYDRTPAIDADFANKTGRYEDVLSTMDKNIARDPSVGVFYTFKGQALMLQGKKEEATDILKTTDPLYSDDWFYLRESTKLHYYLENYKPFEDQLKRLMVNFSDRPPLLFWLNAVHDHMNGDYEGALSNVKELQKSYENETSGSPAWFIALYYCTLQDYDKAFIWLQRSYDRHEVELTWFREEPLLIPLKNDPRYKVLYDKIGFSKLK